jgi:hypothetical protein
MYCNNIWDLLQICQRSFAIPHIQHCCFCDRMDFICSPCRCRERIPNEVASLGCRTAWVAGLLGALAGAAFLFALDREDYFYRPDRWSFGFLALAAFSGAAAVLIYRLLFRTDVSIN